MKSDSVSDKPVNEVGELDLEKTENLFIAVIIGLIMGGHIVLGNIIFYQSVLYSKFPLDSAGKSYKKIKRNMKKIRGGKNLKEEEKEGEVVRGNYCSI